MYSLCYKTALDHLLGEVVFLYTIVYIVLYFLKYSIWYNSNLFYTTFFIYCLYMGNLRNRLFHKSTFFSIYYNNVANKYRFPFTVRCNGNNYTHRSGIYFSIGKNDCWSYSLVFGANTNTKIYHTYLLCKNHLFSSCEKL